MSHSLRRRLIVGVAAALVSFLVTALAPLPALARPIEDAVREASGVSQMIGARRSPTENAAQIKGLRAEIKGALASNAPAYRLADLHEQVLRLGVDDAPTWLGLARAYMGNGMPLQGAGAAWIAFQKADTDPARGEALATVGAAFEKGDSFRPAREAYRQALGFGERADVRARLAGVEDRLRFRVTAAVADNEADSPSLCLDFNQPLPKVAGIAWQDYVAVTPKLDGAFRVQDQRLCLGGASFGTTYKVSALKGLPSAGGEKLAVSEDNSITVGDRAPSLGFRGNSYILPKVGSVGVPLVSINVDTARITLYRVNDRSMVRALVDGNFLSGISSYGADMLADRLGDKVWQGTVEITAEKNRRTLTALPMDEMRREAAPGVYVLTAASSAESRATWEDMATQWVVVTDIGLSTVAGRDGLHVFARSLQTGRAIAGLDLRLYGRNNDELARASTDAAGAARFDPGLMRGRDGRTPTALMAFGVADNYAFLDLGRPAFDLSDRGVGGRPAVGALDAFVYADRGVYRPGETAHLMGLVRDPAGRAVPDLPITLRLMRPDGVEASRQLLTAAGAGAYAVDLPVSTAARSGTWTAQLHTDPEAAPIGSTSFLVEDVVPARIEAALGATVQRLVPGEAGQLDVAAKYLFGAPAAGLRATAEVMVKAAEAPFPDLPGYVFGLVDEEVAATRLALEDATTDETGKAGFELSLPEIPTTNKPLAATLRVDVYEPGGRPVIRSLDLPVARTRPLLGIRPGFADGAVPEGGEAAFDLLALGPDGNRMAAPGSSWLLVEEEWYYQWYRRGTAWDYEVQIRDRRVDGGTLDLPADKPARLALPVKAGRYRLEVVMADGAVASSLRFHAGWQVGASLGDTPDKLDMVVDKPLYAPGATARIALKAPFAGPAQVIIATDNVIETREITIPAGGTTLDVPVSADWGAGAYVLATAFRPSDDASAKGPGRAIGVAWLGVDPADRRLDISIVAPADALPREMVAVPVTVSGAAAGEKVYVTLAAVDEGILQLTDFVAPRPVAHFFGKRRLGLDLRDAYGQLIDGTAGKPGKLREGGDAMGLARRGAPPSATRLVSLFSGIVALDAAGKGKVALDLPDYNGRLRLMAVAWSASRVGEAEAPLVVRDPVVALISAPRFLATGDRSQLALSLVNAAGEAGDYGVEVSAEGTLEVPASARSRQVKLAQGGTAGLDIPVSALRPGAGKITVSLKGPGGFSLVRTVELGVRSPQLPERAVAMSKLEAGASTTASAALLAAYEPGTGEALLSLAQRPNLDVPGLLRNLDRYPYGCAEQTISRALPLLYFEEVAALWQQPAEPTVKARLATAIARIVEMQRANGGLTAWGAEETPDPWLSAYGVDFLVRARAHGLAVPDFAYRRGIAWLKTIVDNRRDDTPDALEARAYAAYVLAAAGVGDLSATRYLNDVMAQHFQAALPSAHLGAAFMLMGDTPRAKAAFARAFASTDLSQPADQPGVRNYGTRLRDLAAAVALAAETNLPGFDAAPLVAILREGQLARPHLSTQEEAWLIMAARALSADKDTLSITVDGKPAPASGGMVDLHPSAEDLAKGVALANAGKGPVWLTTATFGVPAAERAASAEGFSIQRTFFTLEGKVANLKAVPQGATLVAVIVGKAGAASGRHQALVADLLPAGFEIENPRLAGSRMVADMQWLPSLSPTRYADALDDRFVVALDIDGEERGFALAYLVRAVTPGTYRLPAVAVEDMYAPQFRGRAAMGSVVVAPVN